MNNFEPIPNFNKKAGGCSAHKIGQYIYWPPVFASVIAFLIAVFFGAILLLPAAAKAQTEDLPKAKGFVNDFADILKADEKIALENKLINFEKETSNEIALVIIGVNAYQGADRFVYSQNLFNAWKIGKADKNNGILFLITPREGLPFPERGEVFINVGKGLEGALPDALVGSILRNEIFPEFKTHNYFVGIDKGLDAIIAATKNEYQSASGDSAKKHRNYGELTFMGMWLGFLLLSYLGSFLARTKSWWLGGVLGGGGGAIIGLIFFSGLAIAASGLVLGVFGLLFDYIVSKNYEARKRAGKPTDFWHSGGGFWFGGRGGFGGGFSGGGGAGGRW